MTKIAKEYPTEIIELSVHPRSIFDHI